MKIIENLNKLKKCISNFDNHDKDLYFLKDFSQFVKSNAENWLENHPRMRDDAHLFYSLLFAYNQELQNKSPILHLKFDESYSLIKNLSFGENKIIHDNENTKEYINYHHNSNVGGYQTKSVLGDMLEIEIPENLQVKINSFGYFRDITIDSGKYIVEVIGGIPAAYIHGTSIIDKNTNDDMTTHGLSVAFIASKIHYNELYPKEEVSADLISSISNDKNFNVFNVKIDSNWITNQFVKYNNYDIGTFDVEINMNPWENKDNIEDLILSKTDRSFKEKVHALYNNKPLSSDEKIELCTEDSRNIDLVKSLNLKEALEVLSSNPQRNNLFNRLENKLTNVLDSEELLITFLEKHEKINLREIRINLGDSSPYSNLIIDKAKMLAIKSNPDNLVHLKGFRESYQSEELCIEAVKLRGSSLRYVQDKTLKVCLEAVKNNPKSLKHVPDEFQELATKEIENLKQKKKKSSKNKI
jgi:hypothetical protein